MTKPTIIGTSEALKDARLKAATYAESDLPVLILGESGVGKEIVAQEIHASSGRKGQEYVAVNIAGIPDTLINSTLFGCKGGIVTGVPKDTEGVFHKADGGTLFLDEIGDAQPDTQVRLLRVLSEGTFYRVGAITEERVNVRVIGATHRNLKSLVEEGSFREDLYYRLNVLSLTIPPLRMRGRDILLLIDHYLSKLPQSTDPANSATELKTLCANSPEIGPQVELLSLILTNPWPGNIRQLVNAINRLAVLNRLNKVADWGAVLEEAPHPKLRREVLTALNLPMRGAAAVILNDSSILKRQLDKAALRVLIMRLFCATNYSLNKDQLAAFLDLEPRNTPLTEAIKDLLSHQLIEKEFAYGQGGAAEYYKIASPGEQEKANAIRTASGTKKTAAGGQDPDPASSSEGKPSDP